MIIIRLICGFKFFTGEKLLVQSRLDHCSGHSTETSEVSDGSYRSLSTLFKMCIGVTLCAECLGNNSKTYYAIELHSLRYLDKCLSSWQSHENLRTHCYYPFSGSRNPGFKNEWLTWVHSYWEPEHKPHLSAPSPEFFYSAMLLKLEWAELTVPVVAGAACTSSTELNWLVTSALVEVGRFCRSEIHLFFAPQKLIAKHLPAHH